MSKEGISDSISITKIHRTLEELLATYLSEKEESERDNDTFFIEYWDSACQTIYDVAAALKIPFEEPSEEQPSKLRPCKQCPSQLESMTPLGSVDAQYPSSVLSEQRRYDVS
jgi:hypothetical protein